MPEFSDITAILGRLSRGEENAFHDLMPLVHAELQGLARRCMGGERRDHTLEPTALVNEAYLRLLGQTRVQWRSRAHFFSVAAQAMRRVLVDHARAHLRKKRSGSRQRVALEDASEPAARSEFDLLEFEELLTKLERTDPRRARVVELCFFGGLTLEEVAEVLGIARRTAYRDWQFAQAWLYRESKKEEDAEGGRGK